MFKFSTMGAMDTRASGFNPRSYSDTPLFNIQAVAAATGVPSITLRSWERRYGVPEPKRDPKGYRLYSDRDIAITRWLKERVQQGVGISRAVNMLRVHEQGEATSESHTVFDFDSLRSRLVDAVNRIDEPAVNRIVAEALMVATVEEVSMNLLQPTLYEVGHLWSTGDLTVTAEHVGSNLLRSHLMQLLRISPEPYRDARVIVGSAPDELHDIGALTLALFLRRKGFDVVYVGASVEPNSFIADVKRLRPAAVCLSASSSSTVETLAALYSDLKHDYDGLQGFGGRIFNEQAELHSHVSGTYLGADATAAADAMELELA